MYRVPLVPELSQGFWRTGECRPSHLSLCCLGDGEGVMRQPVVACVAQSQCSPPWRWAGVDRGCPAMPSVSAEPWVWPTVAEWPCPIRGMRPSLLATKVWVASESRARAHALRCSDTEQRWLGHKYTYCVAKILSKSGSDASTHVALSKGGLGTSTHIAGCVRLNSTFGPESSSFLRKAWGFRSKRWVQPKTAGVSECLLNLFPPGMTPSKYTHCVA